VKLNNKMKTPRLLLPILALLAACSQPQNGQAQSAQPAAQLVEPTRRTPNDAMSMKSSFAPVVRRAAPAVVNISARRIVRTRDPFWELFGYGVPRAQQQASLGSGAIVRADGVVVTNNHVVEGGQEITVTLADRREFPARILLQDARTDLAILKIDPSGERLPVLPIDDSADQEVGDLVLAIGNPFSVGQTVTNGIISALDRTATSESVAYIQTDAAINPGNSGGPLVDMDGDLIGINSFILSRSGTSSGVGFAIPAVQVRRAVEQAVGGGRTLVRPWLGVRGQTVTGEIARSIGLERPEGVLLSDVYPGGPADRAGLRVGDVVVQVDGDAVNDLAGLNFRVATKRPGENVELVVLRDNRRQTLRARAEAPPATPARDERVLTGPHPLQGVTVVNLSPAVADELGIDPFLGRGVLITQANARGYAAAAGFQPGDIVREVNGRQINTTRDLQAILSAGAGNWRISIERGGRVITGTFRG
jgi:Do/DeqQ family serine protease